MPLMIAGAFAVAINSFPVAAYQNFMAGFFGERWTLFGQLCFNGTTQMVALMVVFFISYNLAGWYNSNTVKFNAHRGICGMVGLASYLIISIPLDMAALPLAVTGATGLFVAIAVSIVSTELYLFVSSIGKPIQVLSDDSNIVVPMSFAAVRPTLVVIALFAIFRVLMVAFGYEGSLPDLISELLRKPFYNISNTLGSAQVFNISTHVMWLFGIHGNNVLDHVAKNVFISSQGTITKNLFDVFVYMGGSGTTLALLISLFVFGDRRSYRKLFNYALPTALFNINEPLIFGIPIVLNPVYAIPFVLAPVVMLSTTFGAMQLGLIPAYMPENISWATPVFFSGYLATGSFTGVILQAFNLFLAVLIYAPFVYVSERLSQIRFRRAYNEMCNIVVSNYSPSRQLINRIDEVGAVARRLANHLDNAIPCGEFFICYQPIINSRDNTMDSVEALLRWRHPQHGLINPMVTVALAEETDRINELGIWVMEQAIKQRAEWNQQGLGKFHISVNVSTYQLNVPGFYYKVKGLLEQYKVDPLDLQIEITEAIALIENEATRNNLAQMHELGIVIAMDDFGVGHSSLLYLRTQPIKTLKIDGSLSREVVRHRANLDIISTICDLCRLLDVNTIIEFVDNEKQLQMLNSVGAYLIQGYYYSQPIPAEKIPEFIRKLEQENTVEQDSECCAFDE